MKGSGWQKRVSRALKNEKKKKNNNNYNNNNNNKTIKSIGPFDILILVLTA